MFVNTCCPRVTDAAEVADVEELDVEGAAEPDTADSTLSVPAEAT
jgi:hypothetical protein